MPLVQAVAAATTSAVRAENAAESARIAAAEEVLDADGDDLRQAQGRVVAAWTAAVEAARVATRAARAAETELAQLLHVAPSDPESLFGVSAREREEMADRRDAAADLRDAAGDLRDTVGWVRDGVADARDAVAEHGDRAAEHREQAADIRDAAAAERDARADRRARAGVPRHNPVDLRDGQVLERLVATLSNLPTRDRLSVTAAVREVLVDVEQELSERAQASLDHPAAARGRRDAADDREASRIERTLARVDRSTSSADRVASQEDRVAVSGAVNGAAGDRAAAHHDRGHAGEDRTSGRLDRTVASRERVRLTRDGLTGVYLRGEGSHELVREVARAGRTGEPLSVAFVDVDGLKSTNDRLGHAAGDRLLVEVARTLRSRLRRYDLIIRYGGDEFVCVLSGCPAAEAEARMAEVNTVLAESAEQGSVTIGIAQLQDGETADRVVARADQALYESRRHGREDRE